MQSIFLPFVTILLAEFFDKSQLALILLATKTKHHLPLLLGALLAFGIVDGVAILFGSFLIQLVPAFYIKIASGVIFLYFGITTLRQKNDERKEIAKGKGTFLAGFTSIFLTEWGDKTQIAAAVFATRFSPLPVFLGIMLAMLLLSVLAVYFGKVIGQKIPVATIHKVAGVIFLLLGGVFLLL